MSHRKSNSIASAETATTLKEKVRISRVACLTVLLLLCSSAYAQEPPQQSKTQDARASVQGFIDRDTALVAWIDLKELDLDELAKLAGRRGPREEEIKSMKSFQSALVAIGATHVYWISDLASLADGPFRLAIPSSNPDATALLIDSIAPGGDNSAPGGGKLETKVAGDVVLVGTKNTIAAFEKTKSEPVDPDASVLKTELMNAESAHGLVFGTSAEIAKTLMDVLKSAVKDDYSTLATVAKAIVETRSATVAYGKPLAANSLKLDLANRSAGGASQLKGMARKLLQEKMPSVSEMVKIVVDEELVQFETNNLEDLLSSLGVELGADRAQRMNDLKQVALALHNYYSAMGRFPPQSLTDGEGKRLLSWRVLILPYINQMNLYSRFKLDESWDSPANLQAASAIPSVYAMKGAEQAVDENGVPKTQILGPMTKESMFGRPGKPVEFKEIRDGSSNTIWFVEAKPDSAVAWSKPEDLSIDEDAPLASIIGEEAEGFIASLVDGAVIFFPRSLGDEGLKRFLTIAGGEINPEF